MTFSTFASPGVSLQGGGGGGGTPGGSTTQIQYNNAGAFAGASGLTTNGTELTVASGTKTANAPVLNMSQTWNNGAVTFTGLKFNAATGSSAGSAAASLLMDLQLEGVSQFSVSKIGALTALSSVNSSAGSFSAYVVTPTILVSTSNPTIAFGGSSDAIISRRGTANLRLGAADAPAPVPQKLSVQSVVASTSNTAGADLTITGSQGTGSGVGGSIIFQTAVANSGGGATVQNTLADAMVIDSVKTVRLGTGYTVATLPAAGTAGRRTYVTDATVPTFLGALTGGGAVVCPVFDNGTAWVSA
jgi:hypothetical protein